MLAFHAGTTGAIGFNGRHGEGEWTLDEILISTLSEHFSNSKLFWSHH